MSSLRIEKYEYIQIIGVIMGFFCSMASFIPYIYGRNKATKISVTYQNGSFLYSFVNKDAFNSSTLVFSDVDSF